MESEEERYAERAGCAVVGRGGGGCLCGVLAARAVIMYELSRKSTEEDNFPAFLKDVRLDGGRAYKQIDHYRTSSTWVNRPQPPVFHAT